METLDFLPLFLIPVLYFATAFLKPPHTARSLPYAIKRRSQPYLKLPFNLCAICVAVSVTWVIMLALLFGGLAVSTESVAILMGMSTVGLMYKMEIFYKEHKVRNFWVVRISEIVGGFYFVLALLNREWGIMFFTAFVTFFFILIPTLFFQKLTHEVVVKETEGVKKSLLEKLEDCC